VSKKIHKDDLQPGETAETRGILDSEGEAAAVQSPDPLTVEQESAREDAAQVDAPAPVSNAKPETGLSAEQKASSQKADARKKGEEASQSPFTVTVGTVYDGPLDLLLDLIRKQDIDIYDIPIARVTKQFLAYVENLKQTDVDSAAEFIYTAALLIHIKSKMLLPRDPSDVAGDAEDPRRELVDRLLEHEKFKSAAQMLLQKQQVEEAVWTNPGIREFRNAPGTEPEMEADTMDLVRVFQEVMNRLRERPVLNVDEEAVTVAQMLDYVKRRMVMEDKPVSLRRLLHSTHSERALICMFLALLELVRLQAVLLRQQDNFGDILIKKSDGFDAVMSEDAQVRDDWA
jgi:segregation and condensation protein A